MKIWKEQYPELEKKALSADATQEDINALGKWFELYGESYWNGEAWDISDNGSPTGSRMMKPVYGPEDEYGDIELIDYKII